MLGFFGVFRHEFNMSIRRKGLWIAYGLLFTFYCTVLFAPMPLGEMSVRGIMSDAEVWQYAGLLMYLFNIFVPVAGGVLAADRLQRDFDGGIHELQESSPLSRMKYILGKYFGVLASTLLPIFLVTTAISIWVVIRSIGPAQMLFTMPIAFLMITVPAFAFVVAFSLALPLIMPLRIYQILFTGYWFWANTFKLEGLPTINGTLLTAAGLHAFHGIFGGIPDVPGQFPQYTSIDAILNLLVLSICILICYLSVTRYLTYQSRRA